MRPSRPAATVRLERRRGEKRPMLPSEYAPPPPAPHRERCVGTKKIVRGDPPGCVIQVNTIEMEITLMRRLFITTAAAAIFFPGGVTNTHTKLVSSSPAPNADNPRHHNSRQYDCRADGIQ